MKNILITGGAGFVGSNLSIELKKKYPSYNINALDNLRRRGSELNLNRLKEHGVNFFHADIRNAEDLTSINDIDFVIDASADPSVLSGISTPVMPLINSNLMGTVNCLELANRLRAAFIFLSTSRIYPIEKLEAANFEEKETRFQWTDNQLLSGISANGITENFPLEGGRSFYGASKLASELIIQEYHSHNAMKTVINRCGVISGPWQMGKVDQGVLVLWLARHYFKGQLNYIGYGGKGKQMRDVLHIFDLIDLIDWQIHNIDKVNGQTYNAGGGVDVSFSLLELSQLCSDITGNKIPIESIAENRAADIRIYVTDNAKINTATGWKPKRNIHELVTDTFQWLQQNEKDLKNIL